MLIMKTNLKYYVESVKWAKLQQYEKLVPKSD